MNCRLFLVFLIALSYPTLSFCQKSDSSDSITVERLLADGDGTTLYYARKLLGRPYVAYTLEVNSREQLVVNLRELDCTTLVETVSALVLCARNGKKDYHSYCHYLKQLRYRQGRLDDYASRLHYFSDWIDDNTTMGLVSEVKTEQAPFSAVQTLNINYMSQHPQSYKALRQNPSLVEKIKKHEQRLTGKKYRYIPKQEVTDSETLRQLIHDGDIIAITCSKPGLDIAHLGFAVWKKDGLHLLNASQIHKKVVEEPMTLGEYLGKHPSHTGIRVVRLAKKGK